MKMSGTLKRGRPSGWRKPDAKRFDIAIRISSATHEWLSRESQVAGISKSEICRQLIERQMTRDSSEKKKRKP